MVAWIFGLKFQFELARNHGCMIDFGSEFIETTRDVVWEAMIGPKSNVVRLEEGKAFRPGQLFWDASV